MAASHFLLANGRMGRRIVLSPSFPDYVPLGSLAGGRSSQHDGSRCVTGSTGTAGQKDACMHNTVSVNMSGISLPRCDESRLGVHTHPRRAWELCEQARLVRERLLFHHEFRQGPLLRVGRRGAVRKTRVAIANRKRRRASHDVCKSCLGESLLDPRDGGRLRSAPASLRLVAGAAGENLEIRWEKALPVPAETRGGDRVSPTADFP